MKIESRGLIYDAGARPRGERVASFTSLCPLHSGTILCGFQLGAAKHAPDSSIRLFASHDGGQTWQPWCGDFETRQPGSPGGPDEGHGKADCNAFTPGSLATAEWVEVEPGRLLLFATWFDRSEPERPLFDPATEGILRSRLLVATSTDDGRHWSPWQVVPTGHLTGCSSTGPVLLWPDGTLAVPMESYKEFDQPGPSRHAAWLVASSDGGRTFAAPRRVAQHPQHRVYYWDQRLCVARPDHDFTAMFWTHDLQERRDRNVHLYHGRYDELPPCDDLWSRDRSADSSSTDQGAAAADQAAGRIIETTIRGQIAAPLWMGDGRLLAFVVDRHAPGELKLWVSDDSGQSWPEERALRVYRHAERAARSRDTDEVDFAEYWEEMYQWTFGHPAIRPIAADRVLLCWYAGSPDAMSVHWARVTV